MSTPKKTYTLEDLDPADDVGEGIYEPPEGGEDVPDALFDAEPPPSAAATAEPEVPSGSVPDPRDARIAELEAKIAQQQASAPAAPEPSVWDRFTGAVDSANKSKVGDFFRGIGRGVTSDWAEEAAAALVPEVDDGTGIPRTYAEGSADEAMLAHQRKEQAEAQKRSPVLTGAGRVGGAVAQTVLAAPLAPATTGLRGAMAVNAAQGLVQGAAQASGAAEEDKLGAALEGGAWGAGFGAALPAAAGVIGEGAKWVAPRAGQLADKLRAGAAGAYGAELSRLAEKYGPEFVQNLGKNIERLKLHERQGAMGTRLGSSAAGAGLGGAYGYYTSDGKSFDEKLLDAAGTAAMGAGLGAMTKGLPSTPTVYRDNAMRVARESGEALGAAVKDATEQGVSFPKEELLERMSRVRKGTDNLTDEGLAARAKARRLERAVNRKYGEHVTPEQLQHLKKVFEKRGGWVNEKNLPAGEAEAKQMYRALASAPRTALRESIEGAPATADREAIQGLALPETAEQFAQARGDFGVAQQVANMARKRVAQEAGNQVLSLPAAAASPGGIVPMLGVEGMKRVGKDVLADTFRGIETGARRVGQFTDELTGAGAAHADDAAASYLGNAAPTGAALVDDVLDPEAAWRGSAGAQRHVDNPNAGGLAAIRQALQDRAEEGVVRGLPGTLSGRTAGHVVDPPHGVFASADDGDGLAPPPPTDDMHRQAMEQKPPPGSLRDAVKTMLDNSEGIALMGPHAQKFSHALTDEDPDAAIDGLIKSMSAPGGDVYFRTKILPELQRLAAEGGL